MTSVHCLIWYLGCFAPNHFRLNIQTVGMISSLPVTSIQMLPLTKTKWSGSLSQKINHTSRSKIQKPYFTVWPSTNIQIQAEDVSIIARHFKYNRVGYILTLGVAKAYRSLGLGSYLLSRTLENLEDQNCLCVYLHVLKANKKGIVSRPL